MQEDCKEILSMAVRMWLSALLMVGLLAMLCLMCGCKTTEYVPVESVRTEYVDRVNEVRVTDSVTNDRLVFVKGDSVIIREWRDRWHTREVHDTIVSVKIDSVAMPYPVEKKLTKWEQAKMDFGGLMLGAVGVLALGCAILGWIAVKRRKR